MSGWNIAIEWLGVLLLFCLVLGMSATVDITALKQQVRNRDAILTGFALQFFILPLLGYAMVAGFRLDYATGVTLLVVTSSPGGSYSNWWCSVFNADLALSVTMTAMSTVLSIILMPINLYIYAKLSYDRDVLETLQWDTMIFAIFVVIVAIGLGLLLSFLYRTPKFHVRMNQLGNFSGISLIIFSAIMSNTVRGARIWDREWTFYLGVAIPCVLNLLVAIVAVSALDLYKPERVTVAVEACYQNTGIAISVALSMFSGEDLAKAIAVPFYYGIIEVLVLFVFCLIAWKAGWTKAPKDDDFWDMITTSYEVVRAQNGDGDADYRDCSENDPVEQGKRKGSSEDSTSKNANLLNS